MPEVIGAIREKWLVLGGEAGFGAALDIERPTFDGVGRAQSFHGGGTISWHPAVGAFAVWGAIGAKWIALGRERSTLAIRPVMSSPTLRPGEAAGEATSSTGSLHGRRRVA